MATDVASTAIAAGSQAIDDASVTFRLLDEVVALETKFPVGPLSRETSI